VFLRNHVRSSKYDDVVEEVELLEANPMYANVKRKDGREQNVSLCDLAPCPSEEQSDSATVPNPDVLVDEIPDESDTPNLVKPSASSSPHVSNLNET